MFPEPLMSVSRGVCRLAGQYRWVLPGGRTGEADGILFRGADLEGVFFVGMSALDDIREAEISVE